MYVQYMDEPPLLAKFHLFMLSASFLVIRLSSLYLQSVRVGVLDRNLASMCIPISYLGNIEQTMIA